MPAWILGLVFASVAHAQPASWPRAEQTLRTHLDATHESVLEIRTRRDLHVGEACWVRAQAADGTLHGMLVFVRGGLVIEATSEAALASVLRADDAVHTTRWTATALLDVMSEMNLATPLPASPIRTHRVRALRPRIERSGDEARWVIHCFRGGPPEAPATEQFWVTRAVLTLGTDYVFRWTTADVVLDAHGRER